MPTVFRYKGVRFHFYSNEGNPREPLHIHASGANGEAKFWLRPNVHVASSTGFDRRTLSELLLLVEERREEIERSWNEYFG
ncbi:DUF4160 domain-containing protein [Caballeronia sp. BR00000012568055]|uniref:DUF4160 domain-containing protein n=1 Tax=Caballeronia sp. BR00000012568055 TaxID=2918761 RepID=UPI0023F8564C|nr:DUF4160 domain-containing protein [Caballeronia sp. BR00000012568055]